MHKQTFSEINKTIECIIDQGANTLYHQYLTKKIPNYLTDQVAQTISQVFNPSFLSFDQKSSVKHDSPVQAIRKQTRLPNKIKVGGFERPHSQLSSFIFRSKNKRVKKLIKKESEHQNLQKMTYSLKLRNNEIQQNPQQQESDPLKNLHLSGKLNFPIKYQQEKEQPNERKLNRILRKELYQRSNMRKIAQEQIQRKRQQFINRRNKLEEKYEQLTIKGISCTFDYQNPQPMGIGEVTKDFRGNVKFTGKPSKQRGNTKITSLKYQTISYEVSGSQPKTAYIQGKKKSIYTNRIRRRPKCNSQEYNNNDKRQLSTIPFVNLHEGIKLIQLNKNVIAQRRKSQTISRQEFKSQNARKKFKSYLPQRSERLSIQSPLGLNSTFNEYTQSRPGTTGQLTTGKHTADTGISKRSILWRPNTTTKNGRVKINKNLIDEIFQ